jgi:hypothetical protein
MIPNEIASSAETPPSLPTTALWSFLCPHASHSRTASMQRDVIAVIQ